MVPKSHLILVDKIYLIVDPGLWQQKTNLKENLQAGKWFRKTLLKLLITQSNKMKK